MPGTGSFIPKRVSHKTAFVVFYYIVVQNVCKLKNIFYRLGER
jgi:hypothetical protein